MNFFRCGSLSLSAVLCTLLLAPTYTHAEPKGSYKNTIYATHRIVQELDKILTDSVSRLNETLADLVARVESAERQTRELMSIAQENQRKLDALQRNLTELTVTLYRHLDLSPPVPVVASAPFSAPRTIDVQTGGITVHRPIGGPLADSAALRNPEAGLIDAPNPTAHYRGAQQLYANEEYALALERFSEHLTLFPDSKQASNAQYWKAHCYFKMGEYEAANTEFELLRTRHPESGKVPIAMHNQAVAYSRLGKNARAEALFLKLIEEHPDDVATEGAREKLRQLRSLN